VSQFPFRKNAWLEASAPHQLGEQFAGIEITFDDQDLTHFAVTPADGVGFVATLILSRRSKEVKLPDAGWRARIAEII
jgi:hypothetical protein